MDKDIQDIINAFINIIEVYSGDKKPDSNKQNNQDSVDCSKYFNTMFMDNLKSLDIAHKYDIEKHFDALRKLIVNAMSINSKNTQGVSIEDKFRFFNFVDSAISLFSARLKHKLINEILN